MPVAPEEAEEGAVAGDAHLMPPRLLGLAVPALDHERPVVRRLGLGRRDGGAAAAHRDRA